MEYINKWKILLKELNIDVLINNIINKNKRAKLITNKAFPDHL